jgi:hypothetical protein
MAAEASFFNKQEQETLKKLFEKVCGAAPSTFRPITHLAVALARSPPAPPGTRTAAPQRASDLPLPQFRFPWRVAASVGRSPADRRVGQFSPLTHASRAIAALRPPAAHTAPRAAQVSRQHSPEGQKISKSDLTALLAKHNVKASDALVSDLIQWKLH